MITWPYVLLHILSIASAGKIVDTHSSYNFVTNHNDVISPLLRDLCTSTDFFKYYKLNLFTRECPYFSEDGAFCGNRACAVDTIEEEDVPEIWRASILGKLSGPSATAASNLPLRTIAAKPNVEDESFNLDDTGSIGQTCVQEPAIQEERNFCVAEDEGSECVYVSLVDNEERYTGYHGAHAHAIWRSIYNENCFDSHVEEFKSPDESRRIDKQFENVLREPESGHGIQDTCIEKRIFYRIISGMHASISTHICAAYLNQLSGKWEPNRACFDQRLRDHPERISNIYFNYVLVSRAISKLSGWLNEYTFCSGDPDHDQYTAGKVKQITSLASQVHYDESPLFEDVLLKEDFRNRFRNISMLMDCVGCDKCRLWCKVQVAGYGTALKILFDEDSISLRRGELVALFNTYNRLSHSLDSLALFDYKMPDTPAEEIPEQVILPSSENPHQTHAGPDPPMDTLKKIGSSVWRDVVQELKHFSRALKFIGQSYIDLPSHLWTHFFVHQSTSFWDFLFKQEL